MWRDGSRQAWADGGGREGRRERKREGVRITGGSTKDREEVGGGDEMSRQGGTRREGGWQAWSESRREESGNV
ncbi:hypothetical protein Pmani_036240 [Petrolisthes manimaculis]|uniref:Uncharacterized protein n=1 Tax=Petrolisthes manimaculis TaxID=1843537 RepID=A0AAE1NJ55_9EUCA|nr:hypothetical protein Pmani_036240 [Petrolisthes manimaculis]